MCARERSPRPVQARDRRSDVDQTRVRTKHEHNRCGCDFARNPRATPAAPAINKPDSATARETLRIGARVLAAYWNEKREFEGFWLATIKRIDHGEFTLEWFDSPEYPAFKSRPQNIAVPHPEFRVSGK